jgi:hypothetical protein
VRSRLRSKPKMASAMKVITINHTRSIDPGDIVHVMPHWREPHVALGAKLDDTGLPPLAA